MPDAPKPFKHTTTFALVRPGWNPDTEPCDTWNPYPSQKEVLAVRAAADACLPGLTRRVIVQIETTYTIVDDGGFDG